MAGVDGAGRFAPSLEEGAELDRRVLADGAPEQGALGRRVETVAAMREVGDELPCPRARKDFLRRPGIEGMQCPGARKNGAPGAMPAATPPNLPNEVATPEPFENQFG